MSDTLYTALRTYKPDKIRATLNDGSGRDIPMPGGSKKLAMACKTIGALPWNRVELLNAAGELLAVVEPEDGGAGQAQAPAYMHRENELADILIRCQKAATQGFAEAYKPILESFRTLLDVSTARVVSMETRFGDLLDLMQKAALATQPPQPPQAGTLDKLADTLISSVGADAARGVLAKLGIVLPPPPALPPSTPPAGGNGQGSV